MTVAEAFGLAVQHHQANRLAEAEAIYRQILGVEPHHAGARHYLGVIAHQVGRHDVALTLIRESLQFAPNDHAAYSNLGEAYRALGQTEEAMKSYLQAIRLNPRHVAAHYNLGNTYKDLGLIDEAIAAYREAIRLQPGYADACNNLGNLLRSRGEIEEAIDVYDQALKVRPQCWPALNNLGIALLDLGRVDDAMVVYRRALHFKPDSAEAHTNLGMALAAKGDLDGAVAAHRRAVEIQPDYVRAHHNLGDVLKKQGETREAEAEYHRVLQLDSGSVQAHNNLASVLRDQGQLDEAMAEYRRALQLRPEDAGLQSNLIYALQFHPELNQETLTEAQSTWNLRFSEPLSRFARPLTIDRSPDRSLRVGYVSPDFRDHVIGRNLLPLFRQHDRRRFEIICYSAVQRPDVMTEAFRRQSAIWRTIAGLPDDAVAEMIRNDRIDILVDLTQHLSGNRLTVFARRPAPVQVSFAGYPAPTGVTAIQYRLSDRYLEAHASEIEDGRSEIGSELSSPNSELQPAEQVLLLDSFWCYDPCGVDIGLSALPALSRGRVTFGSLNNFCKVNDSVLALWAQVLRQVPDSDLLLLSHPGEHRARTLNFLESAGVERGRVTFEEPRPRAEYLELYHRLDVVLDPFPYGGHTTSLDALWMGVPVVSLAGESSVSRAGLSQMSNLGLPELVAFTPGDYVTIATGLAGDLARLAELRRTLRGRMEASPLMDDTHFARQIEEAYHTMWRQWCRQPGVS